MARRRTGQPKVRRRLRRVTLVRGRHRWVFECSPGREGRLLGAIAELIARRDCPLDHFDGAVVAQQLTNSETNDQPRGWKTGA